MTLLTVENIEAAYGPAQALFGVSLTVAPGEVVALLGRNGMGKSTTIKVICGLLPASAGRVTLDGHDMARVPPYKVARAGVGLVPEGRRTFARSRLPAVWVAQFDKGPAGRHNS